MAVVLSDIFLNDSDETICHSFSIHKNVTFKELRVSKMDPLSNIYCSDTQALVNEKVPPALISQLYKLF
jgi:hypothetical protein